MSVRTVRGDMMIEGLWLAAVLALASPISAGHHRRSMPTQAALPVSKGGWRPVIGSGGLVYGAFGTAPLHAPPTYKVPSPVPLDQYASSARPLVTRDAAKLTSIAQSYRPTTLRTVPSQPPLNQPINSYHNPFSNNGLTHYKYIQNFPVESVLIRNPHNPYAARPVFTKYPQKFKQPIQQHLGNVQPVQYQYQTGKPFDIFPKPADFSKPEKKPQSSETEIYKPEVYKLPDNDVAQQALNHQVKTAQQTYPVQAFPAQNFPAQNFAAQNYPGQKLQNPYSHFTFQDNSFPPRIFGTYSPFNVQPVKGQNPGFPTRTTFIPQQPTRQTIFNSFSYSPNFKQNPSFFPTSTPKLHTTANQIHYGTTVNDYNNKNIATQPPKVSTAPKIDPNAGNKFKASPQDPFSKQYSSDYNKVTTYNPVQTTTTNYYNDFQYPVQQNLQAQNYYDQQTLNLNYEKKKNKIHDSFAAGGNQEVSQQYINPPSQSDGTPKTVPFRATYEVTETYSDELNTHSSQAPWTASPEYDTNSQKATDEAVTKQQYHDSFKPDTTQLPEEYAIVTEGDKGYDNSLNYDGNVETQSRRPLGDDFEPIGKNKLKDYYYKVTPLYDDHSSSRRTKKPTEAYRQTTQAVTTSTSTSTKGNDENNDLLVEPLPTLPPNKHFKRPSTPPPTEKEKQRKRIKNRRRRPPLANIHHRDETTTVKDVQPSTEPTQTTAGEEYQAFTRRPTKYKSQFNLTTPGVNDDLITSALPTIAPTYPTIIVKKKGHRRPLTTTERYETTTQTYRDYDSNKESPIMKIATRPQQKVTQSPYDLKSETPDYTHKQDEKDTPTSDIAVSLSDTLKTRPDNNFSFHRDVKPIEAELEPIRGHRESTTQSLSSEVTGETTTIAPRETTPEPPAKALRPRLKNKYESNRPRFSVKDYRNRLSSTTSTTEKSTDHAPKVRFPQRRPYNENKFNSENDNGTERKRFVPKDPRHKVSDTTEATEQTEQTHSRQSSRVRQTTVETTEGTTQKISSRIRNGSRRPRPTTEEPTEPTTPTTVTHKRLIRKKIKDSETGESVQDVSVTETTISNDRDDITSERTRSESAIMKIADKKHHDPVEHIFEHSKRVSDLTLAASKDYNTPGMFKTVSQSSRRVPNYFTIATDDPILPIEAFFPQLNQKEGRKES